MTITSTAPQVAINDIGTAEDFLAAIDAFRSRGGRLVWRGSSELAALEHGGLERAAAELARRGLPRDEASGPHDVTS